MPKQRHFDLQTNGCAKTKKKGRGIKGGNISLIYVVFFFGVSQGVFFVSTPSNLP